LGFGILSFAVDARIGGAGQHLRVAGIREPQAVGQMHAAVALGIAEDRAVGRDPAPEKRHQRLAPAVSGVAPEALLRLRRLAARRLLEILAVGAAEYFLPPHAVDRDDDDVLR
jgi:hypothetical protein